MRCHHSCPFSTGWSIEGHPCHSPSQPTSKWGSLDYKMVGTSVVATPSRLSSVSGETRKDSMLVIRSLQDPRLKCASSTRESQGYDWDGPNMTHKAIEFPSRSHIVLINFDPSLTSSTRKHLLIFFSSKRSRTGSEGLPSILQIAMQEASSAGASGNQHSFKMVQRV